MKSMKWEPGAVAVIVCAEHAMNQGRVVVLVDNYGKTTRGHTLWLVEDGQKFIGFNPLTYPELTIIHSDCLGIEQWKLRLLSDDEETETNEEGIKYALTA